MIMIQSCIQYTLSTVELIIIRSVFEVFIESHQDAAIKLVKI